MKVKDSFFTDTDRENFDQIFGEPDYWDWSNSVDERDNENKQEENKANSEGIEGNSELQRSDGRVYMESQEKGRG